MMKSSAALRALAAGLVFAACHDSGGTLTIALDPYTKLTNATSVPLTGVVTRMPAKNTQIIVTATAGGTSKVDSADGNGHFSINFPLTLNGTTQISISASDKNGGTTPQPIVVSIQQDATPP